VTEDAERQPPRLDETDRRLITELEADPRIAYASLGARLGVTGMTAANRLHRLREGGLLRLRTVPNMAEVGLTTDILGLVQVESRALQSVIAALRASPHVLRVERVTGEFDVTFDAVFPSEAAMGSLVREIQSRNGVRRLVVHHRLRSVKQSDGWEAVWTDLAQATEALFEFAPGTLVPRNLEPLVALAATWVAVLAAADLPRLRAMSTPGIVFTIMPPHPSAGIFEGLAAVEKQALRTRRAYNRLWYRIVAVGEHNHEFPLVLDALSPVEDHRGRLGTAFSRMAFGFSQGRVSRAMSLGAMDLPEVPALAPGRRRPNS
jgi:Lrp/AsnC family transcriptional regulator